jgi:hypothetical protein
MSDWLYFFRRRTIYTDLLKAHLKGGRADDAASGGEGSRGGKKRGKDGGGKGHLGFNSGVAIMNCSIS